ncbi:MAG: hypothetical protein RIM23_10855 [Coleofasciculus sp. G3-WIS-01]|uniref:hypothetical protein n=1 Tax=Coleofasciculus sp. G3-WIS-01 TaxID=3069528 RepID=UPI0032F8714A
MRLSIWDSYTPDTSLLLYPAYSGFLLNSFSQSSRSQSSRSQFYRSQFFPFLCSLNPRLCSPLPDPECPRCSSNNGLSWRPESDNSRNSILTFFNQENQNEPEEEVSITDIVIPMSLYLYQLFEPNLFGGSTSHLPLYHLWSNYLVYLE